MIRPPSLMFGIAIADVTMDDTVDQIGALVEIGRATGRTHQIATVNVDFLVNALDDPDIARILQRAEICIPDGMPIVWGASLLGMPVRERVAGADLVPRLFDASQTTGWRVHVFGSSPDVAARAERLIAERYPRADVTIDPGPMIPDVTTLSDEVLDSVAAVDADILCVALGNPKQERFIEAHGDRLGVPVMIGVGGSLDMLVGERRRAPVWVQRAGLEWVARAVQEPRRLGRRYAGDIRSMLARFPREYRASRRRRDRAGLTLDVGDRIVELRSDPTSAATEAHWREAAARIADGADLSMAGVSSPLRDSAAAQLVGLVALAHRHGRSVSWVVPPSGSDFDELGLTAAQVGVDGEWPGPRRP